MADQDQFLNKIAVIESNNGRNTNHPVITRGVNKGFSAIGKYGLTPLTVLDIASRSSDPKVRDLLNYPPTELKQKLEKEPDLEHAVASSLASRVLAQQGGDEQRAAYSWNVGTSLHPSQISDEKLSSSPYVQKYNTIPSSDLPPTLIADRLKGMPGMPSRSPAAMPGAQMAQSPSGQNPLLKYLDLLANQQEVKPSLEHKDLDSSDDESDKSETDDESDDDSKSEALKKFLQ